MSVKVVLDTNFLLLASIFRGDVFEELDNRIGRRTEKIVLKPVYQSGFQQTAISRRGTKLKPRYK